MPWGDIYFLLVLINHLPLLELRLLDPPTDKLQNELSLIQMPLLCLPPKSRAKNRHWAIRGQHKSVKEKILPLQMSVVTFHQFLVQIFRVYSVVWHYHWWFFSVFHLRVTLSVFLDSENPRNRNQVLKPSTEVTDRHPLRQLKNQVFLLVPMVTFGDSGYHIHLTLQIDNCNIFSITNLFQNFFIVDWTKVFIAPSC